MQKKDLIQLGVTGVLLLVLILAVSNAFKKVSAQNLKNATPKGLELSGVGVDQARKTETKELYALLEQQASLIELKRDPFTAAPIALEKNLQSGVDLTGILWDKDKPLAIIDGEIVKKGAQLGNKTIMEIKKDRVILSDGESLSELRLEQ
jgi:hypothetical protein